MATCEGEAGIFRAEAYEGEVMAVLGLAFGLLVVMPLLIYGSVAVVMRAARLRTVTLQGRKDSK